MLLFVKRCVLCQTEVKQPVNRKVPLRGYSVDQTRTFCSEEHADLFEKTMRKSLKNRPIGCRTCYN
ncbi:MAG: hypothetical protein HY514_01545 [Candidatus Aenigmarchaeota archaeon]|nr:hypothetical protein [Candidatus Aenigmarchaeota archaeon]